MSRTDVGSSTSTEMAQPATIDMGLKKASFSDPDGNGREWED